MCLGESLWTDTNKFLFLCFFVLRTVQSTLWLDPNGALGRNSLKSSSLVTWLLLERSILYGRFFVNINVPKSRINFPRLFLTLCLYHELNENLISSLLTWLYLKESPLYLLCSIKVLWNRARTNHAVRKVGHQRPGCDLLLDWKGR